MARFWEIDLPCAIWLHDGTRLATLSDCGRLLLQRFAEGESGDEMSAAFRALIGAAEAGRPEDVAYAEHQLRVFFHAKALL